MNKETKQDHIFYILLSTGLGLFIIFSIYLSMNYSVVEFQKLERFFTSYRPHSIRDYVQSTYDLFMFIKLQPILTCLIWLITNLIFIIIRIFNEREQLINYYFGILVSLIIMLVLVGIQFNSVIEQVLDPNWKI